LTPVDDTENVGRTVEVAPSAQRHPASRQSQHRTGCSASGWR
jgi:hypothetical protein